MPISTKRGNFGQNLVEFSVFRKSEIFVLRSGNIRELENIDDREKSGKARKLEDENILAINFYTV